MEKGEDLWRNYTVDLSVKISELSGGQSHMLRINGRSGPLILHPLFSGLDKLDFGDGKVAWPFVSLDRFGAIHYTAGWGKVSMWPGRPVFSLHTAAGWAQLSHTHFHTVTAAATNSGPLPPPTTTSSSFSPSYLTAQHHLFATIPPIWNTLTHLHPQIQEWVGGCVAGGRVGG